VLEGFISELPLRLLLIAFFLGLAFPIHEFAHASTAVRLGDETPRLWGKLTLNPIAHFDRVGGTMLIISTLFFGFPFGWAQTPVNPSNLRGGRRSEAYVAIAGPIANLIIATGAAIPFRYLLANPDLAQQIPLLDNLLYFIIVYSVLLGIFNLIPIPPLDGGAIMLALVPPMTAWRLRPLLAQYGFLIIIVLFFIPFPGIGTLGGAVLLPVTDAIVSVLVGV
jgi:Zn-dependent protease